MALTQEEIDTLDIDIDRVHHHDHIFRQQFDKVRDLNPTDINHCLETIKEFVEGPLSNPLVRTFRILDPQPVFIINIFDTTKMYIDKILTACFTSSNATLQQRNKCFEQWNKALAIIEEGKKKAIFYNKALAKKEGRVYSV